MQAMCRIAVAVPLVAALAQEAAAREGSLAPEAVVAGFEQRVEQMFRAESGKPLVRAKKQKPLGPGRGNYVRAYSYSMVAGAIVPIVRPQDSWRALNAQWSVQSKGSLITQKLKYHKGAAVTGRPIEWRHWGQRTSMGRPSACTGVADLAASIPMLQARTD